MGFLSIVINKEALNEFLTSLGVEVGADVLYDKFRDIRHKLAAEGAALPDAMRAIGLFVEELGTVLINAGVDLKTLIDNGKVKDDVVKKIDRIFECNALVEVVDGYFIAMVLNVFVKLAGTKFSAFGPDEDLPTTPV